MFTSAATPVLVKKSFLSQLVHFHHRSWWYILQPTNKWMGEQTAQYLTCTYFHYCRTRVKKVKIWNVTVSRAAGYNQMTHQPAALHPQLCCAGLKPVRLVCCSLYLMLWTQLWCTHCSAHLVLLCTSGSLCVCNPLCLGSVFYSHCVNDKRWWLSGHCLSWTG